MYYMRNLIVVFLLFCCWVVFTHGSRGPDKYEKALQRAEALASSKKMKTYVITYRVDQGNKRGKEQQTTINAFSTSEARENFKIANPDATIVRISEKS